MTCKGICIRYKAQKPVGTGRYASGQRRCQICEIFIKWEGLWCPCCGYRLRTKPRNLKYKAKLRARVEADSLESKSTKASSKAKKTSVKTLCKYCKKLFVNLAKHQTNCKKKAATKIKSGTTRKQSSANKGNAHDYTATKIKPRTTRKQ